MATTKHTGTLVFGRCKGVTDCPRCAELNAGAAPVQWRPSRRQQDAQRVAEIRAHDCRVSRCASVCTFGEW
jgi:hypothetical protein